MFPSVYGDVREMLIPETVVFIQGKVDTDREPPSVLVDKILPLDRAEGELKVAVSAEMILEELTEDMLREMRDVLIKNRGNDPVFYSIVRREDNAKAGPFRVGAHLRVKGNDQLKQDLLGVLGPSTKVHIGARL